MNYAVKYINCKICGKDNTQFLGTRGNLEFHAAPKLKKGELHMVTNVVKCNNCGFIYTNPKILISKEYSDTLYNNSDRYISSATNTKRLYQNWINIIQKYKNKGKLLDIGCGKGEFLEIAKQRGWQTFGVEMSKDFAVYARKTFGMNVLNAPIEKANFPKNYFDVVTLNMVLEHIDEPHSLLQEIHRVLKDDGILFIELPNMDSLLLKIISLHFRLKGKCWSPHLSPLHPPYHCYGYSKKPLKLLLEINKFFLVNTDTMDGSLRGFRNDANLHKHKYKVMYIIMKLGKILKKADILIAVAKKHKS